MSSQDYEFLTQQMATAIELDEKKRGLESTIEMKRNDIAHLQSNFSTKFSQDVPPKPPEWSGEGRCDVNSEHAKLRRLENAREMLDESVSSKARFILVALSSGAVIITASAIYWAKQDVATEGQKVIVAFLWCLFIGLPFFAASADELDLYYHLRKMFLNARKADYDSIDAEILGRNLKINIEEVGVLYSEWEKRKSREHAQLDLDIDVINHLITSVEKEILVTVHAIKNAFRSVSHFTPYNDRVVFGEQKILGNDMSNPDSVDTSFLDELL